MTAKPEASPSLQLFQSLELPALIDRYAKGVENFDRRVFDLTDAQLDTAFLPDAGVGRWPARVLLGHLADAELAQVHRIRRTVAEDNPVVAAWDENAFIDAGLYGSPTEGVSYPIGGFIGTIHTLRRWTSEWLRTLDPDQWSRQALHPEKGPQTTRSWIEMISWHLEHHAAFLNLKIAKMLGPREASER
jgi:hypothetical protein